MQHLAADAKSMRWSPYLTPQSLSYQEIQTAASCLESTLRSSSTPGGGKVEVRLGVGDYASDMVAFHLIYLTASEALTRSLGLGLVGDRAALGGARRQHLCGQ